MPLESATYIADLVQTNPLGSDLKAQGDDHFRMMKTVLQTTFPGADHPWRFPMWTGASANFSVTTTRQNQIVGANATSGNLIITLPDLGTDWAGLEFTVQKTDATSNVVRLSAGGSILVNGVASVDLDTRWAAARVVWTGDTWRAFITGQMALSSLPDDIVTLASLSDDVFNRLVPSGLVAPYAGTVAPTGWLFCFGQSVLRADYPSLFSAIGTTYGTVDGSHFTMPDIRGRVIAGQDDMGGVSANRITGAYGGINGDTLGDTGGAEAVTLTIAEMPLHGHPFRLSVDSTTTPAQKTTGGFLIDTLSQANQVAYTGTPSAATGEQIGGTGGSDPHANIQPTIILNYMIKAH